jgi:tetratricopeptide (TPR) repeat protein
VHTSVDWLHLIPGVTGVALFAAAVLVGPWRGSDASGGGPRRVVVAACVILAVFGAVLIGRSALAERYREDARDALPEDPVEAIRKANDSLALNDEALPTYYVKAAAEARLNQYARSRASLAEAARREPHEYVPWALLGDLAVRRGDLETARRDYGRASDLNPRDPGLARLAEDPRGASQAAPDG